MKHKQLNGTYPFLNVTFIYLVSPKMMRPIKTHFRICHYVISPRKGTSSNLEHIIWLN